MYQLVKKLPAFNTTCVTFAMILAMLLLNACTSTNGDDAIAGNLTSIIISNDEAQSFAKTTKLQLIAAGVYSNEAVTDLTESVIWKSMDTSVVSFSTVPGEEGLLESVELGTTQVTASVPASGVSKSLEVTVTLAPLRQLQITPDLHSMPRGKTVQFKALGILRDGTELDYTEKVTWLSQIPDLATVSDVEGSKGLATAVVLAANDPARPDDAGGEVIIAANFTDELSGFIQDIETLTVRPAELETLSVSPNGMVINPNIIPGQQFTVAAVYTDGTVYDYTSDVAWTVEPSDGSVATVSNDPGTIGYVTGVNDGQATIRAQGTTPAGLTVDSAAQVTVSTAALDTLTVTPATAELALGTTLVLSVEGTYADGNHQDLTEWVDWSSSDPLSLSVENSIPGSRGVVRGDAVIDNATVTATVLGVSGHSTVTVTPSPLSYIEIYVYGKPVPNGLKVPLGAERQLTAMGFFENGSSQDLTDDMDWVSAEPGFASVGNEVTPVDPVNKKGLVSGNVISDDWFIITVTDPRTSIFIEYLVMVSSAELVSAALDPAAGETTIAINTRQRFRLLGTYTNGSVRDITNKANSFFSQHPEIAAIENNVRIVCPNEVPRSNGYYKGVATALSLGTQGTGYAQIGVGYGTKTTYSSDLRVKDVVLQSISVDAAETALLTGEVVQFSATGHFSDGSTQDITEQVEWSSDNNTVAAVENFDLYAICSSGTPDGVPGQVTAVGAGTANIIATDPLTGINKEINIPGSIQVTVQ